jgi:UDP-N-acetylglucosamine:LPS N-acetylglucosamine transferase
LVLLPHDISESAEMMEILQKGLDRIEQKARFLIKCHHHYSPHELKHAFGGENWPDRVEFFQGTLADAFKEAAVVISSNSSAMAEAAAMGIPVIFLGRQTALNQNVLETVKTDLIKECFTTDVMVATINQLLHITSKENEQYKILGKEISRRFFSPITAQTMSPFLGKCRHEDPSPKS